MSKIFFDPSNRNGNTVTLPDNTAHHMINVLRMRIGQTITLCDGQRNDYQARIESATTKPSAITFTLLSKTPSNSESIMPITLYQGLPKSDKMDWIIEKCVEIGVHSIIPVCTTRSIPKIKDFSKKAARFSRIAESAASQSMRGILPTIEPMQSFGQALAEYSTSDLCLVAYENEKSHTIKSTLKGIPPKPISIWIGPEGGFDDNEIMALADKGALPVSLGPRVLRTETAGLVALSQILCIWDEFN